MIFFSIPSVGQLKPDTLFGKDDHFGFIRTLIGEEYIRGNIKNKCGIYYDKTNNRYWDQIITLINFLGIKKLDEQNRFSEIPILGYIADQFDNGNNLPSNILFDYLLCQWQFPHPIVTKNTRLEIKELGLTIQNQRATYPIIKPYAVILSILKGLYLINPDSAYLTDDEFYWLGYTCYEDEGIRFSSDYSDELLQKLLDIRNNGGWEKFKIIKDLPQTSTHLSYPYGFLRNSSILTAEKRAFNTDKDVFIGLKPMNTSIISQIDSLIEASTKLVFEFDRSISERDNTLGFNYINYLYSTDRINEWLSNVEIYKNQRDIFKTVSDVTREFNQPQYEILKVQTQLKRLSVLDKETITRRRTEQHILRNHLLKGEYGQCAICSRNFPVKILECAHIKKRTKCSDSEKRDLNVVMPACHLGCNKLYEDGYIIIQDGKVKGNLNRKIITDDLKRHVSYLDDKTCLYWKDETKAYFNYHSNANI